LACLAASALAAYLFLGRTRAGDSPWALFALTDALASVILVGAMAASVVLSTLLSAALDDRTAAPTGPSESAERTERTDAEADHRRDRPQDDLGARPARRVARPLHPALRRPLLPRPRRLPRRRCQRRAGQLMALLLCVFT
jgi:hypothetical protein